MELHSFDHRLNVELIPFTFPYPREESDKVREVVKDFGEYLELDTLAQRILNILIQQIGTPANSDPVNRICVDELLLRLYNLKVEDPDSFEDTVLETQLHEMATGMCPAGRTIRLVQVLYSCK